MNSQLVDQHWFVSLNGKRYGPYTFAALNEAAAKGFITAETHIWRLGWQQWHLARQVPGLLNETPPPPEPTDDYSERTNERPPEIEAESAPSPSRDDRLPVDDTIESPRELNLRPSRDETASLDAPRLRGRRSSPDGDTPGVQPQRGDQPLPGDEAEDIFVEGWGVLDARPTSDNSIGVSSRFGHEDTPKPIDLDNPPADVAEYRPSVRKKMADRNPAEGQFWRSCKRAVIGLFAILLLAGAGWGLFASGLIARVEPLSLRRATGPKPSTLPAGPLAAAPVRASGIGLPASIANLPAVAALQRNDPDSFERFKRRYFDSALNTPDDEVLSIARAALRKSVKHLLAVSSGDVLLEITEAYLAYMQALQSSNPESCVALSDESKGATLTSNLAKEFPVQFIRDMSVLERIAGTNPNTTVAPPTADQARPHLETVFNNLRQQPVKSELLGRDKLNPSEFQPYCALVIAFYQTVLDLPRDDKINLLRYLYASAAIDADSDLAK